jgi:hypothetical protein
VHRTRVSVILLFVAGLLAVTALAGQSATGVGNVISQATPTLPPEPTPAPSTVDMFVQAWEDLNGDGRFQPHEPPLIGLRVNLAEGECGAFPFFTDARATNEVGLAQFQVPVQESTTISLIATVPDRLRTTTPVCRSLSLEPGDPAPQPLGFGAYRPWDLPVRASFLLAEERGDQIWVPVSDPDLVEQLEGYAEGNDWWYCGKVVPESLLEWGFNFDPATAFMGEIVAEAQQTATRFIAADPELFGASDLRAWCIMVQAVRDRSDRPAAATAWLPYVTR